MPSSRFRVDPVASGLALKGWDTKVTYGYGAIDASINIASVRKIYRATCRIRRAFLTAFADIQGPVLVQRLAWPWWGQPESTLGRKTGRLVFDFDDAVFLGADGRVDRVRSKALDLAFRSSAHVVAGNSWLANVVASDVPVTVIPTCIDTAHYRPGPEHSKCAPVRIGWIGTSGNLPYLQQLVEPIAKLRSLGFDFEFVICSDILESKLVRDLGARFQRWTSAGELGFLQSLDIGLMPLADDVWCKGKCSFKMIQYMAVGCPVVASAVGMNVDVLNDGGGYLVDGADWVSPLAALLESAENRHVIGTVGRDRAVRRYDVQVATNAYERILRTLQ